MRLPIAFHHHNYEGVEIASKQWHHHCLGIHRHKDDVSNGNICDVLKLSHDWINWNLPFLASAYLLKDTFLKTPMYSNEHYNKFVLHHTEPHNLVNF